MLRRTLLMFLLVLAVVVLLPQSWANDPRSANLNDATVQPPESDICVFVLVLRAEDASTKLVKKIMSPYRVVDFRITKTTDVFVSYVVRISCPGDKKGVEAKLLREDLPFAHPDRLKAGSAFLSLWQVPEKTK